MTLFGIFLKKLFRVPYRLIFVFVLLIPAFFQFTIGTPDAIKSLDTAHVAFFQFLLVSWILFLKFIESKKCVFYFLSLVLYVFATQYFEAAFIMAPVYFMLALSGQKDIKDSAKLAAPFAFVGGLCIALWFVAKALFPMSSYNVTEISLGMDSVWSFVNQFFSAFPLTSLSVYYKNPHNIYRLITIYDWLYCAAVASIAYFALRELKDARIKSRKKNLLIPMLILFIAWITLVFPVSISAIYKVGFGAPYPFVYCQYYLLLGLIIAFLIYFKNTIEKIYPVFKWLFSGIFFVCALGNTLSNKIVEEHYKPVFYMQNNFETALKSGLLERLQDKNSSIVLLSKVYAWRPNRFFYHHSRKKIEVYPDWESFYATHMDMSRQKFTSHGYRKDRVSLKTNGSITEIDPDDGVFSFSLLEKGPETVFVLARILQVDETLSSSGPIFKTKDVFVLSAEKGGVKKEQVQFSVVRKVADVVNELKTKPVG